MSEMSVAVPTHTLPDGRMFISDQDWFDHDWVRYFVAANPRYWTHDDKRDGWVSPVPGPVPDIAALRDSSFADGVKEGWNAAIAEDRSVLDRADRMAQEALSARARTAAPSPVPKHEVEA